MAAYDALNSDHLGEAESLFQAILVTDPKDSRAVAGMGYVRMQQGNFSGAVSYLDQAHRDDPTDAALAAALDTARFWFTINEGKLAFEKNDLSTAEKRYRAALALRPASIEALNGLGDTLLKAQQPAPAIPVFESSVQANPAAADAWRGLFLAQLQTGQTALALATDRRIPAAAHTQLMSDPLFLRSLASAYSAVGREGDAQTVLAGALNLPFPADAKGVKLDSQFQFAGILLASGHLEQAAGLYRQVLAQDPSNVAAWQGLLQADHGLGRDAEALQRLQDMPPATNAIAMLDPEFIAVVASTDRAQKKIDEAQDLLQKAIAQQTAAGQSPSVAIEIELAGIYMDRGTPQLAFPIYRRAANDSPNLPEAWAGLVTSLHLIGRDEDAAAVSIPGPVSAQLQNNLGYLRTMASVYAALGQSRKAATYLSRVEQVFADEGRLPPADVEIQLAWLLNDSLNGQALYRELMALGGRSDLSDDQRRTVQTIWANWAVRSANQDAAAGNPRQALAVLDGAAKSFSGNPAVLRALAGGYLRAGQPRRAVAIYKSPSIEPASVADFQVAVDAALAANNKSDAQRWVIQARTQYPRDPQVLILAAKVEEARGDPSRAIRDSQASLRAMPPQSSANPPTAEPPAPDAQPGPVPDLSILLAPGQAAGAPNQPYLPSSGATTAPSSPAVPSNPSFPDTGKGRLKDYVPPQSRLDQSLPDQPAMQNAAAPASAPAAAPAIPAPEVKPSQIAGLPQQQAVQAKAQPGSSAKVYDPYAPYVAPPKPDRTSLHPSDNFVQTAEGRRHANSAAGPVTTTNEHAADTAQTSGSTQVSRPPTPPAAAAGAVTDTGTQQYPQPRTMPRSGANLPAVTSVPAAPSPGR